MHTTDEISSASRQAAKHTAVRDATRLINFGDVAYQLGTVLYKKSLRYTLLTAGIALLGYSATFAGIPGFSAKQALALPLIVGGVTLLSGVLLRVIPAMIASRQMMIAQANDLNLMEDYRKSESDAHLDNLWERVFRYEWRLGVSGEDPSEEGGRAEFLERANQALDSHLSQPRERYELGIDLHHFEDWQDGAYFDQSDVKLVEQYEGDIALLAVKRWCGVGAMAGLRQMPTRYVQRVWFGLITRAVASHIADAVDKLNRKHDTEVFNSQVLIWPGEENHPWLEEYPGAREEVLRRRRKLLARVFGPDRATARNLLDRMFAPNFEIGTRLRIRFDVEYCAGGLDYTVLDDLLLTESLQDTHLERYAERFVSQTKQQQEALTEKLAEAHPELLEEGQGELLRAARLIFHTDRRKLRSRLLEGRGKRGQTLEPAAVLDELVALAREDVACYSRRLLSLRLHHELCRLERYGYYKIVDDLWPADLG